MKLTVNNAEFDTKDLTDEQRQELLAELNKPKSKRWVPKIGDYYWYVNIKEGE